MSSVRVDDIINIFAGYINAVYSTSFMNLNANPFVSIFDLNGKSIMNYRYNNKNTHFKNIY